jgi:hypothetical protein
VASKELDDILNLARTESAHGRHFYVGIEHLFIVLTKLKGGVTASTLEEYGIAPRFVRYVLRQEVGQGDNRRFWPGFRETPRLQRVLRTAQALASARGSDQPTERDLLLAILQETDSLPVRVLRDIGADIDRLIADVANWSADMRPQHPEIPIRYRENIELSPNEIKVLQQMFRGYEYVMIERRLEGGYTSASLLVAYPYRADGRADAAVVVKLDERQAILYEKLRYDSFVRDTLPPTSARMLDNPIVPDRLTLGGLKYTFVRNPGESGPVDLVAYARDHSPEELGDLLRNDLYLVFGETWWLQRQPYRFNVWQEYEFVLPPALVLEATDDTASSRQKLIPSGNWSRRGRFAPQELVILEGFTVQEVHHARQAIQLSAGAGPDAAQRAFKVEVRGVDVASYYRTGVVDRLVGRVLFTRGDLLREQAAALEPDFPVNIDLLPQRGALPIRLPNPLTKYPNLLERSLDGTLSTIHGDLHLRNILVGPGGNAWLIDFAETREGHTLFDWAVLETSLLVEIVAPQLEPGRWEDIWPVLNLLFAMEQPGWKLNGRTPLERALVPVVALRGIVAECLADPKRPMEYFVALALCALRVLKWNMVPRTARRLLFLVSSLAMASAGVKESTSSSPPDTTQTEIDVRF